MLKSEHAKALREVDTKFEELIRTIPDHILSMKMGEVKKLKDFNEALIEEKMTNLNMTVMDSVQKADEGKQGFLFSVGTFGSHCNSFILSILKFIWLHSSLNASS